MGGPSGPWRGAISAAAAAEHFSLALDISVPVTR